MSADPSRTEPPQGIDADGVGRFFAEHVPGGEVPLEYSLIAGGRSNLTYLVSGGGRDWVLRRPPLGHVLPTAHDMSREYRVLRALAGTALPVPRTFALCEDETLNGAPFYVMAYTPGVVIGDELPQGYAESAEARRGIGMALMETLARLHAVDPEAVGLGDFGRPTGYLERQVRRWAQQWERSKVEELPAIDALIERLRRALPETSDAAIVHGDYRLGNVALDPIDPARIVAIFDWEMATLGDPLADLGYTLIYWSEASDAGAQPAPGTFSPVTAQPGFLTREELVAAYSRASGRDVTHVDFYQVLALYKLAVISEGIYARYLQGKTLGEGFDGMQRASVALARRALAIADRSPSPALRG